MPDNRNESRFMAMLERKGIVHRTEQNSGTTESNNHNDSQSPTSPEDRFGFDSATDEAPRITPAARQPIPGMSVVTNSIMAESNYDTQEHPNQQPVADATTSAPQSSYSASTGQVHFSESTAINSGEAVGFEDHRAHASQPVDLTAKYLAIEELFEALSLRAKRTDTIYLVEEYIKTLPPSLPDEAKRDIVGKIITASGFDFDLLMGDGVLRVKMLKDYAEKFAQRTDDYVSTFENELSELERKAASIRSMIDDRRELHKKQFMTIEAEAQRLKDILTFLSG